MWQGVEGGAARRRPGALGRGGEHARARDKDDSMNDYVFCVSFCNITFLVTTVTNNSHTHTCHICTLSVELFSSVARICQLQIVTTAGSKNFGVAQLCFKRIQDIPGALAVFRGFVPTLFLMPGRAA